MKILKSLTSLNGKFTLSFFFLSAVLFISITVLLYTHERGEHHTKYRQLAGTLILQLDEINLRGKSIDYNKIEQRIEYSDMINAFRKDFDYLLGDQIESIFKKNDSSSTEISLNKLTEEEQLLYFSHDLWNKIRKNTDYVLYNDITYDSVYTQVELQKKWETDSLIKYLPLVNDLSKKALTNDAKVALANIGILTKSLKNKLLELRELYEIKQKASYSAFSSILGMVLIIDLFIIFIFYKFISNQTFQPLKQIRNDLAFNFKNHRFSKIEYNEENEIGEITQYVNYLIQDNKNAQDYIKKLDLNKIEEANIIETGETSPLKKALIEMHEQLREIAIKENQRNWMVEGQAIFSDVLSKHSSDFNQLCDEIIKKLVQYTSSLQGGLFILNRSLNQLDLTSCYAYDRKKFKKNHIELGEGIVGQVWQEQKSIFITDLPEEHMTIKSGLGSQTPKCLLVVPLIDNNIFYGVLEIASFKLLERYKVEFVEKIAENIASTLAGVETTKRTQLLLAESQELTLKMKEQEEEMLQNLEELQATQEEMRRREMLKEKDLMQLKEETNKRLSEASQKEESLRDEIKKMKESLANAVIDNTETRRLNEEITIITEEFNKKIKDLEETIKIKDLRIEKLRKKIDN